MEKTIEIPEGYEARIEGNKVILERKESENEKIRTRLIALVEAFCQGKYKDEMLAYPERQKEQQPSEWVLPEDFEEAVYKVANFISPFDNQEELRKTSHCFAEQLLSLAKKELGKLAEWSLTDATFIEEIDETLFMAEAGRNEVVKNQIERERNWLKSLQERFNFQPKIEWSKEDKRCFDEAIEALESLGFDGEASNLKSLRDNYKKCNSRWKPSEEQAKEELLKSLQQEQPETPSGEEVMTMCNQILIDWVKEGKTPEEREQRERAHIRFFELYDEYMERPDVDLDAEIAIYLNRNVLNRTNNTDIIEDFTTIEAGELARHFYELGLNARKK